jgi:undecaprenyl-diphosphatase
MVKQVRFESVEGIPTGTAVAIGFIQCLAMIPGVSRSGATIMGALLMGVERKTAAEFSFFLAVPTMAAATSYACTRIARCSAWTISTRSGSAWRSASSSRWRW